MIVIANNNQKTKCDIPNPTICLAYLDDETDMYLLRS